MLHCSQVFTIMFDAGATITPTLTLDVDYDQELVCQGT